ncbi:hypothetical protein [Aliidiomarina indica]|uniref:hypothetical protein n=1 Tax=Aliidiomarina indica TaxID=2749147 RepID=UPI00188E97A5|nr:hypothetical protein [Aliidiomarina indica]
MKPSSEAYSIVASPVFRVSLVRFRSFIEHNYSAALAEGVVTKIKTKIKQQLSANPSIAPISERLLNLGIADYRQWCVDDFNLVFYRVDEVNHQVELLALISAKQSIRKLLFEVNLLL